MGTYQTDATLNAAQREFNSHEQPTWELKPHESVCTDCHLVHAGECW